MDGLEKMLEGYPPFMTLPELSEVLRNDVDALRNRMREGSLPGFQPIGLRWAMTKTELIDFLRSTRNLRSGQAPADLPAARTAREAFEIALEGYPNFLNVHETAEVLRVDPAATRVRLKEGTLPGYQPSGKRWIVAKSELIEHFLGTHNSYPQGQEHADTAVEHEEEHH